MIGPGPLGPGLEVNKDDGIEIKEDYEGDCIEFKLDRANFMGLFNVLSEIKSEIESIS